MWSGTKSLAEAQGSIGTDRPFAGNDLGKPVCRDMDGPGEFSRAYLQLFKFVSKDFAGMDRGVGHSVPLQ